MISSINAGGRAAIAPARCGLEQYGAQQGVDMTTALPTRARTSVTSRGRGISGEAVWVWTLIALTAFGAALRFHRLGSQSYWGDEDGTIYWARGSIKGLIVGTSYKEATPPLYFVAAWMWAKVFGLGEIGMRSLSALAGTATIPVVYLAGRTLASRTAGLIAAAFAATSPLLVWYSQEARGLRVLRTVHQPRAADVRENSPDGLHAQPCGVGCAVRRQPRYALLRGVCDPA